jgi:hypothetical protein
MADSQQSSTVAQLLSQFRNGDASAAGHLIEVLHPELRRIAGARMKGERIQHTWQPTVLVNELYLALVKRKDWGMVPTLKRRSPRFSDCAAISCAICSSIMHGRSTGAPPKSNCRISQNKTGSIPKVFSLWKKRYRGWRPSTPSSAL